MPRIQGVLFDADGVLQKTPDDWIERVAALAPEPSRKEQFLSELFLAETPCMRGEEAFEDSLRSVLSKWGSGVPIDSALKVWTLIEPDREILALVERVRNAGFKVALATNQQAYRARFMSQSLGYASLFDGLLYSCELGSVKPSADYFAAAAGRLELAVERLLFIDDSVANTAAAVSFGMKAEAFCLSEGAARLATILESHDVIDA
jgi:putative hydrolase of the HAD superfamily